MAIDDRLKGVHQFSHIDPPMGCLLTVGWPDGRVSYASLIHPLRRDGRVYPILIDGSGNAIMIMSFQGRDPDNDPIWWKVEDYL